MDAAPFKWAEQAASSQRTSMSFAVDSIAVPMTFRIDWADLKSAIKYILGYANVGGLYSDWKLNRALPAKHPIFPWMRATKITSLQGEGPLALVKSGQGFYGSWGKALLTVMFESLPYPVREDAATQAEYQRYTIKKYEPNLETLERQESQFNYLGLPAGTVNQVRTVPGRILLKQAKGYLEWTWYHVPEDWIMLGKLIPTNIRRCVGTVNLKPFPFFSFNDQNQNPLGPQLPVQYKPGTLLMLEPKIDPTTQLHPNLLNNLINEFYPRTYTVVLRWLEFDPDTDSNIQVNVNGTIILIRGNNLLPLPIPSTTGKSFYPASMLSSDANPPLTTGIIPSDVGLLYRYQDHETAFSWARSL